MLIEQLWEFSWRTPVQCVDPLSKNRTSCRRSIHVSLQEEGSPRGRNCRQLPCQDGGDSLGLLETVNIHSSLHSRSPPLGGPQGCTTTATYSDLCTLVITGERSVGGNDSFSDIILGITVHIRIQIIWNRDIARAWIGGVYSLPKNQIHSLEKGHILRCSMNGRVI